MRGSKKIVLDLHYYANINNFVLKQRICPRGINICQVNFKRSVFVAFCFELLNKICAMDLNNFLVRERISCEIYLLIAVKFLDFFQTSH